MGLFNFFIQEIAMDLGTANTLIIHNDEIVVNEPSIVALDRNNPKNVLAVGKKALMMHEKTHESIRTVRPLKDGVIADFNAAELMIRELIKLVLTKKPLFAPKWRMMICIPSSITEVEKRAVRDSAEQAGAQEVYLLHEPMAAALGIGIDVEEPVGNMIIDIGGGTSEIAVISLGLDADLCSRAGMHSTSDFPAILGNTVNRVLRAAYQQEQRTFTAWCRQSTLPDFREAARVQLSESPKFSQIKEGGEYKMLAFGDSAEKISLSKFGGIVPVTWETLINDDLDAFSRIPMALAAEAAATESDIVYGILSANPKMSDNKALFHVDHGNLAAAGAGIDVTTLTAGRAAIRKQTGLKGRKLNLAPEVLLVGPDLEGDANKYTSSQFVAAKSVDTNPAFNTSLEVVVEQRIEGNPWFLTCRPGRIDTIYPEVDMMTRTGKLRIELPNPDGRLRANMFAEVEIMLGGAPVVQVPEGAVIDTGDRQVVIIDLGEGRFRLDAPTGSPPTGETVWFREEAGKPMRMYMGDNWSDRISAP